MATEKVYSVLVLTVPLGTEAETRFGLPPRATTAQVQPALEDANETSASSVEPLARPCTAKDVGPGFGRLFSLGTEAETRFGLPPRATTAQVQPALEDANETSASSVEPLARPCTAKDVGPGFGRLFSLATEAETRFGLPPRATTAKMRHALEDANELARPFAAARCCT